MQLQHYIAHSVQIGVQDIVVALRSHDFGLLELQFPQPVFDGKSLTLFAGFFVKNCIAHQKLYPVQFPVVLQTQFRGEFPQRVLHHVQQASLDRIVFVNVASSVVIVSCKNSDQSCLGALVAGHIDAPLDPGPVLGERLLDLEVVGIVDWAIDDPQGVPVESRVALHTEHLGTPARSVNGDGALWAVLSVGLEQAHSVDVFLAALVIGFPEDVAVHARCFFTDLAFVGAREKAVARFGGALFIELASCFRII